jgi:hypothetical protein
MPLDWKYSTDGVDWEELSALYPHEDCDGYFSEPATTAGAGLPE